VGVSLSGLASFVVEIFYKEADFDKNTHID